MNSSARLYVYKAQRIYSNIFPPGKTGLKHLQQSKSNTASFPICHVTFTAIILAGMGLGGGSNCKRSDVEIADGELGSGDGRGKEQKGAWRKGCHICSEEPPNQRAEKISLEEQLILSY